MIRGKQMIKKASLLKGAIILVIVMVLLMLSVTSCGKREVISREVEAIFEEGIFEHVDLSLSPLDELALPKAELEIPSMELPDMDIDFDLDVSSFIR